MKFRYKVLIINIILLSLGISIVGFVMVDKNISLALDTQTRNAIDENNMLQGAIEFKLLDELNNTSDSNSDNKSNFISALADVSETVSLGVSSTKTTIYVLFDNQIVYHSGDTSKYVLELAETAALSEKKYIITEEEGIHYIYVTSSSYINDAQLNIINRLDITEVYTMLNNQIRYFYSLLLVTALLCSIFMYIISRLLTKPLEHLTDVSKAFGDGDYTVRSDVKSHDEIGELSNTYNYMAQSVSDNIDALNEMIKNQDQFIADFTHEIKTPMTSIIGYADTLRSRELTRENQILCSTYIFKEGKRLEKMSMKLFDLILTKQKPIDKHDFNVGALFNSVAESTIPALEAKSIELETNFEDVSIYGDIDLLKSAFINIIDNARKASEENSKILFSGVKNIDKDTNTETYTITVKDFGRGIPKEHLGKIKEAFYMVDKSRSRKEGGAGLGLSLAHLIFGKHDATTTIESEPGKGTSIIVTFPLSSNM